VGVLAWNTSDCYCYKQLSTSCLWIIISSLKLPNIPLDGHTHSTNFHVDFFTFRKIREFLRILKPQITNSRSICNQLWACCLHLLASEAWRLNSWQRRYPPRNGPGLTVYSPLWCLGQLSLSFFRGCKRRKSFFGWEGKGRYGLFHMWINAWVAGKTVWLLNNACHTCAFLQCGFRIKTPYMKCLLHREP